MAFTNPSHQGHLFILITSNPLKGKLDSRNGRACLAVPLETRSVAEPLLDGGEGRRGRTRQITLELPEELVGKIWEAVLMHFALRR